MVQVLLRRIQLRMQVPWGNAFRGSDRLALGGLTAEAVGLIQEPCKLSDPHEHGPEWIGLIEMIRRSPPPCQMAFSANEDHGHRIEVPEAITQMMCIDAPTTT